MNTLLQEDRCLTGPEPGLTRDAITKRITLDGHRHVELVDTAGWIRKARLSKYDEAGGEITSRTLEEARTVLRFVHVVVLVVDAKEALERREGLTHAEASLAAHVVSEGRVLLLAANKMDSIEKASHKSQAIALIQDALERAAPEVRGRAVMGISALQGEGVNEVLPLALHAYEKWCNRVTTSKLNRWMEELVGRFQGGGPTGDLKRIKFMSQIKSRPPTFVVFVSGSSEFGDAAKRFLSNQIRASFGFGGVPVRIEIRKKERRQRKA